MLFLKQVEKIYKSKVYTRFDDYGVIRYFAHTDFDGLNCEPYPFKAFDGHNLSGYIYSYGEPKTDRIIVFDHGIGSGHRGYMKEIEMLARHGYTVFAYDHTGCMESEGDSTNGLCQSLYDLDSCLTALKSDEHFKNTSFSVMGHSWGGFSTMNVVALHPDITHIVAIAGFISVKQMVRQSFAGIIRGYAKYMYALEEKTNPKHIGFSAPEVLKDYSGRALLIYSSDDDIIDRHYHYDVLKKELEGKKNIHIVLVDNKGHNPHYTASAVKYKDKFFSQLFKKIKAKAFETEQARKDFINSYDWDKMTEQDDAVWKKIFAHLDS